MSKRNGSSRGYQIFSLVVLIVLALLFLFPLYWIVTGALKTPAAINSPTPQWWPEEFTLRNFQVLFSKRSAPLFQFGSWAGPTVPGAIRWLLNTVFMAVMAVPLRLVGSRLIVEFAYPHFGRSPVLRLLLRHTIRPARSSR